MKVAEEEEEETKLTIMILSIMSIRWAVRVRRAMTAEESAMRRYCKMDEI